ncbi:CDP-glycerol glycerophosphotransferase family protein [Isoptericola sp. NEAU-Y5]|uniref:CDP-glycerol glycerophosphotransferase family protein n=1 Tax=Isoptericola luteus TaxID=2879484 RepID=A0ABS7ZGL3_9MICO|nr:CDP-glycerol glycerophosphotransferase family protein [Isoptericola sp. NEAU-Y5]MCA5892734.1 CDP-glycerol glycerophosphotransferase family protein [Isoptericola sp. NEAU-Y5]
MNDLVNDLVYDPADDVDQPADLSLVLLVTEENVEDLPAALEHVQVSPALQEISLAIVRAPGVDVGGPQVGGRAVTVIESASESEADLAVAACDWLEAATTRYVSASLVPRATKVNSWQRKILREVRRLDEVPLSDGVPLFVWTDHCIRKCSSLYIHRTLLTLDVEPGTLRADFLGRLALASAIPMLEAVDPLDGDIEVLAFLSAQLMPEMDEPLWRYRYVLTRPAGDVVSSDPISLTPRIDPKGVVRWEELRARLPLAGAGNGHSKFVIELDTQFPELALRRNLRPRRGALISARTVRMPVAGEAAPDAEDPQVVTYLLHTTGGGGASYLTTQVGSGRTSRLRWAGTLLKKDLGFILRGRRLRRMRWLRLLRLLTMPFFAGREIWLIGERRDTAQDNGVHLFKHLRQTYPRRSVYYIIDPSSPQYQRVAPYGNVIAHSSWRHQLLMLHAAVVANAYSIRYLIPDSWGGAYTRHIVWRVGAIRVYLKHGVHLSPNAVKRGTTGYDVCLTVMPGETKALASGSGYHRQLVEAGMPRYDALTPTPPSRTILFMPTWRKYLVTKVLDGATDGEVPYEGSVYQRFMTGLLESERLQKMLEKHDYRLQFVPHYNMAPRFVDARVAGDRIQVADTNTVSFQDLIRGCDAFVTDYSSVHFDVAYVGTPIVYARFDEDDFETKHASPSWFDYEKDGFGPVVRTLDETLDAVQALLERDCAPDPYYAARVDATFASRDQQNCARTVAAIEARIPERRGR